jgi:hypothetical protein
LIKLRFRLVVGESNWPLLTGGRYSQVVVKSGLTVLVFKKLNNNFGTILAFTLLILGGSWRQFVDNQHDLNTKKANFKLFDES